ncbi:MAG: hypothetical protein JNJ46_04705 [Myxococcales bacterium]|nr:hypothetical protein [Myxococcales bacterium]
MVRWAILIAALLFGSGSAVANPVLVVGFQEEGRPSVKARHAVMQFLQRMGEDVVTVSLAPPEQACNQTDCLLRLADRYQAARLVGGEITPNDTNYRILVWIFDRVTQQPSTTEARCSECTSDQLYDTAARTAGQLLEAGQTAAVAAAPGPSSVPVASPSPAAAQGSDSGCRRAEYGFSRGIAIGALAALTGATLTTGFAFLGLNGRSYAQRTDGGNDITLDFMQHYRWSLGLSAIPAAATLAAALPWRDILSASRPGSSKPRCQDAPKGRWSFRRGIAIGSLGALTVAGLASSIALTAVSGSVYAYNNDGSPVTYSLRAHYSAGYALTAVMAAGLGLSIAIP